MTTNPPRKGTADRTRNEQIALMLGWTSEPHEHWGRIWTSPDGSQRVFNDKDFPFWDTDKGTAIEALTTWCKKHNYAIEIYWHEDEWSCALRGESPSFPSNVQGNNQSLARAICDAMLAANKSMEETGHE